MDHIRNRARIERDKVPVDEPHIAAFHAVYFHTVIERGAHHRADAGVHTGRVAAARQNRYFFHTVSSLSVFPIFPLDLIVPYRGEIFHAFAKHLLLFHKKHNVLLADDGGELAL